MEGVASMVRSLAAWTLAAAGTRPKKTRPFHIVGEGSIGVGKTETLREMCKILRAMGYRVVFREENVQRWLLLQLLQPMYVAGKTVRDPSARSVATCAFNVLGPMVDFARRRLANLKLTAADADIIVEERGPSTTLHVFNTVSRKPGYTASYLQEEHEVAVHELFGLVDTKRRTSLGVKGTETNIAGTRFSENYIFSDHFDDIDRLFNFSNEIG